jgi:putative endonuclease
MHRKYKKMIKTMLEREEASPGKAESWFLYILQCRDESLYTGITKDLDRRLKMHETGKASRYTRTRRPVTMLYHEKCGSRSHALVRECQVKAFPKQKKIRLIAGSSALKPA